MNILYFTLILTLAGLVQSITGFGFGLVALALLGMILDIREASVLLAPAGVVLNLYLFWRLHRHFHWKGLIPLAVSCVLFVPFGSFLLFALRTEILNVLLGSLMIYAAVQKLLAGRNKNSCAVWHPLKAGIPCGALGGLLTGAFGTGGPPIVSYLLNRPLDRFAFIASTQLLLALGNGLRTVQFFRQNLLDEDMIHLVLPGIFGMLVGARVGLYLLHRLSETWLRRVLIGFLLITGVYYFTKIIH